MSNAVALVAWLFVIAAYWVPTIIAVRRKVPHKAQIVALNLFLGWTFIGWVLALVWALKPPENVYG